MARATTVKYLLQRVLSHKVWRGFVTRVCHLLNAGATKVNGAVCKKALAACFILLPASVLADGALPDNEVMLQAMVAELDRSMSELVLADLPRPYFIQYRAQDRLTFTMTAAYGGLLSSDRQHTRPFRFDAFVGCSQSVDSYCHKSQRAFSTFRHCIS